MRRSTTLLFLWIYSAATFAAGAPAPVRNANAALRANAIRAHLKFLSSDLLEGRGPGTRGDELATNYIASQFESFGLKPAGDNGSYLQLIKRRTPARSSTPM